VSAGPSPAGAVPPKPRARRPFWRNRWWAPSFALGLGAVVFAAFALGGNARDGAIVAGIFVVVAAVFAFGTRSDTLQGLGGAGRDERWAMIDLRATALAGLVTVVAIIGAWLWEIAHGRDGSPYGQLAGIGGLAYVVAVALLRSRG